ncbi:MAG: PrpR N-terminal domain-containing protein [Clostridia bacterium]|nr:PrpR N-terminal domain-containing protein [Clostridia bacterium]
MNTLSDLPISILAIAPYESMSVALQRAAEAFPNIHLDIHTGDLQDGVAIVREKGTDEYDAILSRGGTAEMIRETTNLPVIEIPVSVYDILRTIKLSENYTDRFAIVGFQGVTENAHTLCNLLRLEAPIETVYDSKDVLPILKRLHATGINTIICDMVTHRIARSNGLNALLINSGESSLHQALQEAELQGSCFRRLHRENIFLRAIVGQNTRYCVIFNENGQPVFNTTEISSEILPVMQQHISRVPDTSDLLFYHQSNHILHAVYGSSFRSEGRKYFLFRDQSARIPLRSSHPGIRFFDYAECEHFYEESFFSISGAMGVLESKIMSVVNAEHAVILSGEEGTGREQIARALYLKSRLRHHPFVLLDGGQINDKTWDFLFEHASSPLYSTATTICFQNLHNVPEQRFQSLLSFIENTSLTKRLWLIFSCTEHEDLPVSAVTQALSTRLGPIVLQMPTLRSRKDEIPALSSLYIGSLNTTMSKQISGFEPGALEMLVRYDWPENYTQFKHVLHALASLTEGPYILSNDVAELLAQERRLHRKNSHVHAAPSYTGQTLDEITKNIIRQVLDENDGNQSLTARQLGIGRSTLWRLLNGSDAKK